MEHDGTRFEEDETVLLEDRHLTEGLQGAILRFVLIALLKQSRLVWQAGFLQRPAYTQIAHLAAREVWNPIESRDGDHTMSSFAFDRNSVLELQRGSRSRVSTSIPIRLLKRRNIEFLHL